MIILEARSGRIFFLFATVINLVIIYAFLPQEHHNKALFFLAVKVDPQKTPVSKAATSAAK